MENSHTTEDGVPSYIEFDVERADDAVHTGEYHLNAIRLVEEGGYEFQLRSESVVANCNVEQLVPELYVPGGDALFVQS